MRDWDTRINTLKSDIQAAREKYVIPFMKAQPKPAPPQKEVSQTPSANPEENKVETSAEATTEKLYENKDPMSSLDLIDKTNEARNETNLGLTEDITNKIDSALEQTKPEEETPAAKVEETVVSAEEVQKSEEIKVTDKNIKEKEEGVDKNQTQKSELELLEERDEDSLTEEEEDRMYELRRLRAQKRINEEVREEEQVEFKKADEEIAHLKTLLKPKKKKLPKGYVE